jgi:rubrerythrin
MRMKLKDKIKKWRQRRKLMKLAKEFNKYKVDLLIDPRWMCNKCGAVHAPAEKNIFVGYIYPACCDYPKRYR